MAPTFAVNGAEFAKADRSTIAGKVGYTTLPRLTANDPPVIPAGGWAVGINAQSKNVESAWAFIKWVTSAKVQLEMSRENGSPARYSALQDPDLLNRYPWLKLGSDAEKAGQVSPDYRPRYPFYPKIEEALGLQLNLAALGQATPEEALAKAQKDIVAIVREAGFPVR
jgi:multiple sugar transport system substrate-binding protein